jgi:hypothetical protein
MAIEEPRWKVGELARATGLTVRTLHDYGEAAVHEMEREWPRLYERAQVATSPVRAAAGGAGVPGAGPRGVAGPGHVLKVR